jgi:creatinine amidohydrolase
MLCPKRESCWNNWWIEAESVLTPETVVVIPLGAASKEHGPHLWLND